MNLRIEAVEDTDRKSTICRDVLADLPDWFGIPEANEAYSEGVRNLSFRAVLDGDRPVGFCCLKENFPGIMEIYVMGLKRAYHRSGIGRRLLEEIFTDAASRGCRYVEVKTLDESAESEEYRRTRLFYRSLGFMPLDVLRNEWGSDNPCLILIKAL